MILFVDSSVLVKLYVGEPGSAKPKKPAAQPVASEAGKPEVDEPES